PLRPPRRRPVPRGAPRLPAHDGHGEPGAGRLRPPGPGADRARRRAGLHPLPAAEGAGEPEGRHAVGRRAADAGDRPRADGPADGAAARRAVDGALADPGGDDLPGDPGHQQAGHDHPPRRAERPDGAAGRPPRLRDPDRPDRPPGHGGEPPEVRPRPEDVPRREVAGAAMADAVHYEGFRVGDRYRTLGRTVSDFEILSFATLAGFTEPLFMDLEYIQRESVFKTRVAPGVLTFAIAEGLALQTGLFHGTGLALMHYEVRVV